MGLVRSIVPVIFLIFSGMTTARPPSSGESCPTPDAGSTAGQIIINEMSFHGDSSQNDWFELYINEGSVDLTGWQIRLLGRGGIDQIVNLPSLTFPWNNNSSGKFLVMASSTGDSVISAAIASGTLIQGSNLFFDSNVDLHNTLQEIVMTDADGNLVYYVGYANQERQLDYDCIDQYPDYSDYIPGAGNSDTACTDIDGVSSGDQSGDWIAGCNGQSSVGETNDPVAAMSHYLIEHNAEGTVDNPETITVTACLNSDCTSLLDEDVTLDVYLVSGTGSFDLTTISFSGGVGTVELTVSSAQTVQLGIRNDDPDSTYQCLADDGSTSCEIVYAADSVDHYELSFNTPACVDNDVTLTVNACADANCTNNVAGSQTIDLTYNDGADNTIIADLALTNGVGSYNWSLSSPQTVTLGLANASVGATNAYECDPADCQITFDGYSLIIDTSSGAEDQLAVEAFSNITDITVAEGCAGVSNSDPLEVYIECDNPSVCTSNSENDFEINGTDYDTEAPDFAEVVADFDEANGFDLSNLVFNDAGQITVTFRVGTATASYTFYVHPEALGLMHNKESGSYHLAGSAFDLYLYAYGQVDLNNNILLRNYIPSTLQANVDLETPASGVGQEGMLTLLNGVNSVSIQTDLGYVGVANNISNFSGGESSGMQGSYDSAGTISLTMREANYLNRGLPSVYSNSLDTSDANQFSGAGSIGTFIPAYLNVSQSATLANSCDESPDNTPYQNIGEEIQFNFDPVFIVTALDESGNEVNNFDDSGLLWTLDVALEDFSLSDTTGYTGTVSDTLSSTTLIESGNGDYDGQRQYQLGSITINYEKTATNVAPFSAALDFVQTEVYLPDGGNVRSFNTSTLDASSSHQVCYQESYSSSHDCEASNDYTDDLGGARMLYTRLAIDNTFGSETESLMVPIRSQYWDGNRWVLNTDDDCNVYNDLNTEINPNTYTSVESTGGDTELIDGLGGDSTYDGFVLSTPDENYDANNAEVELEWNLGADTNGADVEHMMIDWDGNGLICTISIYGSSADCNEDDELDYPRAIATFGRYRGNDRIIHWREVY